MMLVTSFINLHVHGLRMHIIETNINNNNIDDKIIRSVFDISRNKTCQEARLVIP